MKKIKLETLLISAFLIISMVLLTSFNMNKPRILILQSYDKSYAWTRDVDVGLNRVFNNPYQYNVRWYYMDTKRHPHPDYKDSAGIAARRVIEQMQPDVVIAIDDDAQKYVARYFLNDPKIKIVFSGVNNKASDYDFDHASNVTGILERIPLAAIRETFMIAGNFKTLNHPIRVALLGDKSESVNGDSMQVKAFNWDPVQLASINRVATWPEWQANLHQLETKVDVILLTGYRQLHRSATDQALVPPREVVAWTEAQSKVPVISGNGFYTEDGGMLAIGTSPYEQGEEAARKALEIIDGKRTDQIPIITGSQFIVTMNGSKMKARGFDLPRVYEAAARTGNKYYP